MGSFEKQTEYTPPLNDGKLHSDIIAECKKAFSEQSPWTPIRPLKKGVDDSDGASCDGSAGNHHIDCTKKVEAVQYSSAYGESQWYCEEHAVLQNEWDIVHYRSKPKPQKPLTEEEIAFIKKLLEKGKKKKKEEVLEESEL